MKIYTDMTSFRIEAMSVCGIADFVDDRAGYFFIINLCGSCYLAENMELVCRSGNFTGNSRLWILSQDFIENLVGNLITYFIWMSTSD